MEDFESLHFVRDWGALIAEDGELASVPDLVRVVVRGGVPSWNAVDAVLDRIGQDANVRGYITHPHKYARPIGPHYDWSARFATSRVRPCWAPRSLDALRGLEWLIAALRAHWKQTTSPVDWQDAQRSPEERFERRLYVDLFDGQFAIHLDDARRLFKDELLATVPASMQVGTLLAEPAPPAAAAAESGSKVAPHVKGESWSETELQTMRDLREAGVSDVEIATRFGCARAIIHQQIGARKKRVTTASGSPWPTYGRPHAVK